MGELAVPSSTVPEIVTFVAGSIGVPPPPPPHPKEIKIAKRIVKFLAQINSCLKITSLLLSKPLVQWIAIVSFVAYNTFWQLADKPVFDGGFNPLHFVRADKMTPFFAGLKLPSIKFLEYRCPRVGKDPHQVQ